MTSIKLTYGDESKVFVDLIADMGVGIGGDRWPAATLFCEFMTTQKWSEFFTNLFLDKKIIELGSGTGLVSIVISKLFRPREIIVTDQESHMDLIRQNLEYNEVLNSCKAHTFDWKTFDRSNPIKYDVILALECVYHEDLYQPLIDSIVACATPESTILLGFTRDFMKPTFFNRLRIHFEYSMIPHRNICDDNEYSNIGIFACRLLKPPPIRLIQYVDDDTSVSKV